MMTRGPSQQGRALGLGGPFVQRLVIHTCCVQSTGKVEAVAFSFFSFLFSQFYKFAIRYPSVVLKCHSKQTSNVSFHSVIFQKPNKLSQGRSELGTCPWVSRYKHQEYFPTQWSYAWYLSYSREVVELLF